MKFRDEPIITSKGETDSYEMSTAYAIAKLYPDYKAVYEMIFRTKIDFPNGFEDALREQVQTMRHLTTPPGLPEFYKKQAPWISGRFIDGFFSNYQFDPDEVEIRNVGGQLVIRTEEVPFHRAIHWPYRIMPLVNELRNRMLGVEPDQDWEKKAHEKWEVWREHQVPVAEFGLRRRAYGWMHKRVLEIARESGLKKEGGVLLGTSDIQLAFELGLTPIGTQDHAWIQFHTALSGYVFANIEAMKAWLEVYPKNPGYVLTDTYTNRLFLACFLKEYAVRFTGPRPDSGDPYRNTRLFVEHYRKIGLDPRKFGIIHSNNLKLWDPVGLKYYADSLGINMSGGIGGFLTNDPAYFSHAPAYRGVDYVMKLVRVTLRDGTKVPVCKLSDEPAKATGDPVEIARAKAELGIK